MSLSAFSSIYGITHTIQGAFDLTRGSLLSGLKRLFLGTTFTNAGGGLAGLDSENRSELIKDALVAGAGAAFGKGVRDCTFGIKEKNGIKVLHGGIQALTGVTGAFLISSLDAKVLLVANQASILALSGAFIAKLGFHEVIRGDYAKGVWKLLLGAGGIASAGYYVYSTYFIEEIPQHLTRFIKEHETEIERLHKESYQIGDWKLLGLGKGKKVFIHPDVPEFLFKVPRESTRLIGDRTSEENVRFHYANLKEIQQIAARFDRVVVPQAFLFETSQGPLVMEERFCLGAQTIFPYEKDEAIGHAEKLIELAGLCDIDPSTNRNSRMLWNVFPSKIALFDFDCRIVKPLSLIERLKRMENQMGPFFTGAGISLLEGCYLVTKKIAEINPNKVIQFGFFLAAIDSAVSLIKNAEDAPSFAGFGPVLMGAGIALAATAVNKAYFWIKNSFPK